MFLAGSQLVGQPTEARKESTSVLIEKLGADPSDLDRIGVLARRSDDPSVIPALRELFDRVKQNDGRVKEGNFGLHPSQLLAINLYKMGVHDDVYVDNLLHYAREAIAADPPVPIAVDAFGKSVSWKQHNPAFDTWCAARGLNFESCWYAALDLGNDLILLRAVRNKRAITVFRESLKMLNYAIIDQSVYTLAEWDDTESIPLIEEACLRLPAYQAESIALTAAGCSDSSVEHLLDRFVKDPQVRARAKQLRMTRSTKVGDRVAK